MSPADSPFTPLPLSSPHPTTEQLRAYAAGTLAPSEQHHIEAHALDCERCANLVDGFLMTDAATTDHALAGLRTRLQTRLGEAAPVPITSPATWPRVAAAVALLGVVSSGLWTWEHQQAPTPATTTGLEMAPPPSATATKPQPTFATTSAPTESIAPTVPVSKNSQKADYATVQPARSPRFAASHRSRQTAAKSVSRITAPEQAAPVVKPMAPVALVANADNEKKPATKQQKVDDASPATARIADTIVAEKTGMIDSTVLAGRSSEAQAATNKAVVVRVANTRMPAALAINPAPMGGGAALRDYVRRAAATFEPKNDEKAIVGTVRIKFIVEADGKLSNLKVVRGMRPDYDSEALRIVCNGPAWQPGVSGGRRAPLPMEVTVSF